MPIVLEISAAIQAQSTQYADESSTAYLFDQLPYGLLAAACILYYTLPQATLLWTEADREHAG